MLFGLGAEAEFVDVVDDFAEVVAASDAVFEFAEDFADFVFDGAGAGGFLLEGVEIGEELEVDEVAEVVAGAGGVVIEFAVAGFGSSPCGPAVGRVEDVGIALSFEGGLFGFICFEAIEVFQEEEPGGLLGLIELAGATGFFAEDVIDVSESLFEH